MNAWRAPGIWILIVATLVVVALPVFSQSQSLREVIFTMLLSIILASSLNIIMGYTGYVSFGHVVFFGLGGYVGLYLINSFHASLWVAMLASGLAASLLAFLLGKAILRLRGAYFALSTIGINEAMKAFINNFTPFGAATGISLQFSVYKDYGGAAKALWLTYFIAVGLAILAILLSHLIRTSKFGLGLMAIREDEDAAEVMGVVTPNAKTWAYAISAILPAMIGAVYYFKNGNIEPADAFRLGFSIETLVMVMLGGFGTVAGPVLGAVGYQRLRGLLQINPLVKDIQLSVAGVLLLVIILFIPDGLVGWLRKRFTFMRRFLP